MPPRPSTSLPPRKHQTSRLQNVEKAMITWAKNEREKGRVPNMHEIAFQALEFSASAGGDNDNALLGPGWIQKFTKIYVQNPARRLSQVDHDMLLPDFRSSDGIIDTTEQDHQRASTNSSPWRDRSASVLGLSTSSSKLTRRPVLQSPYTSSAVSTGRSGFVNSDVIYSTRPSPCSGPAVSPDMYAFVGHAVKRARPITAAPTLVQASSMPSHFQHRDHIQMPDVPSTSLYYCSQILNRQARNYYHPVHL